MSKVMPLADAVRAHVRPGLHLHFASTPSRSNASILEVARQFRNRRPEFVLSTTGFHSLAHLLGILRLGRRLVACFFGDNYPVPRPNPLYETLEREGVELEHWSLWSLVSALRAGALGQPYAVTNSLAGSTLGAELARAGKLFEVRDPCDPARTLGLVAAMRPDVTFVHAAAGDPQGRILISAPYGEGLWSANGAKEGVIVTVEQLVDTAACARLPEALQLPPERVLAVSVAPFGAHPQPLYTMPSIGIPGYADDFEHYRLWRCMAVSAEDFASFRPVLEARDGRGAYLRFAGASRLDSLRACAGEAVRDVPRDAWQAPSGLVILAARKIAERVTARGYRVLLAGIGHSFAACRLAREWLASAGIDVALVVETGLIGVAPADDFLLSYANMDHSLRLASVEHALGTLVCGADNRALGVLGAAQVDCRGNVNSTRLANGTLLVGSGGANDVASSAAEVIVLVSTPDRLVSSVDYVTSVGRAVLHVVTEKCTFARASSESAAWSVSELTASREGQTVEEAVDEIRSSCPWDLVVAEDVHFVVTH